MNYHYSYNTVFMVHDLKHASKYHIIHRSVHYQLLTHLPDDSMLLLLYILNNIWLTQDFSFRHIALTCCLHKIMERMVNSRITWYLERHMTITKFQSGFRRRRSTVDNHVTLETSIRDTFVGRKHLVCIFFFI